jgi:hypothetical protein
MRSVPEYARGHTSGIDAHAPAITPLLRLMYDRLKYLVGNVCVCVCVCVCMCVCVCVCMCVCVCVA